MKGTRIKIEIEKGDQEDKGQNMFGNVTSTETGDSVALSKSMKRRRHLRRGAPGDYKNHLLAKVPTTPSPTNPNTIPSPSSLRDSYRSEYGCLKVLSKFSFDDVDGWEDQQ